MAEQEKQELSKAVADKYGIGANNYSPHGMDIADATWLHDDSARCFDLFAEHEIDINNYGNWSMAVSHAGDYSEYTKNNNNDKAMTARIAGLKALLAKD